MNKGRGIRVWPAVAVLGLGTAAVAVVWLDRAVAVVRGADVVPAGH